MGVFPVDSVALWSFLSNVNPSYNISHKISIAPDFFFHQQDFVDRFIMIDSEEKVHSLFNFEQSHHFGLR